MYQKIEFLNIDETMIRAHRVDGSVVIVEPATGDLYEIIKSGLFGEIEPYIAPPEPAALPKREPALDLFRLSLIAAKAFADGIENPTDDEIRDLLNTTTGA